MKSKLSSTRMPAAGEGVALKLFEMEIYTDMPPVL